MDFLLGYFTLEEMKEVLTHSDYTIQEITCWQSRKDEPDQVAMIVATKTPEDKSIAEGAHLATCRFHISIQAQFKKETAMLLKDMLLNHLFITKARAQQL